MSRASEWIDAKIIYAVMVSVLLFAVLILLPNFLFFDEVWYWILFFITFFATGVIATGVKRSAPLGFILCVIFLLLIIGSESPSSLQRLTVEDFFYVLLSSAIAAVVAAVGGFLGERIFR